MQPQGQHRSGSYPERAGEHRVNAARARPATTSRVSANATWVITSASRPRWRAAPTVALRPPSFSASVSAGRAARSAGSAAKKSVAKQPERQREASVLPKSRPIPDQPAM